MLFRIFLAVACVSTTVACSSSSSSSTVNAKDAEIACIDRCSASEEKAFDACIDVFHGCLVPDDAGVSTSADCYTRDHACGLKAAADAQSCNDACRLPVSAQALLKSNLDCLSQCNATFDDCGTGAANKARDCQGAGSGDCTNRYTDDVAACFSRRSTCQSKCGGDGGA